MDHPTFDELSKSVATATSRRQWLTRLAAGLAITAGIGIPASGLFQHGVSDAAAACRQDGGVCSKNADCCNQLCLPKDRTGRRYCATPTPTATSTNTATVTDTATATNTATVTDTATATNTATVTDTATATNTPIG